MSCSVYAYVSQKIKVLHFLNIQDFLNVHVVIRTMCRNVIKDNKMKSVVKALGCLVCFSASVNAYVIDTEACAGTEYIYDQTGDLVIYDPNLHTFVTESTPVFYAGYSQIPYLSVSNVRFANIRVSNVSDRLVSFYYRPTYIAESTGLEVSLSPEAFGGIFKNDSPLDNDGANMPPNSFGRITVWKTSQVYQGFASIYWNSSECGVEPIVGGVENLYSSGSAVGISVNLFNDGNPF